VTTNYVLVWSVKGEDREFILRRTEYFLGRPSSEDLRTLTPVVEGLSPFDVLIYPASPPIREGEASLTGFKSLTVSRRHAKLLVERREGNVRKLIVIDHGPEGKGSRNGTFINGAKLKRGERRELREGDAIRLSAAGPTFIVGVKERGETVIKAPTNVPVELPVGVANALIRKGLVLESKNLGDKVVVVLGSAGDHAAQGVLVKSIASLDEFKRRHKVLTDLLNTLYSAQLAIKDNEVDKALMELRKLRMDTYWRVLNEVGDKALLKEYRELRLIVKHGGAGVPKDDLLNKAYVLCEMLKAVIERL